MAITPPRCAFHEAIVQDALKRWKAASGKRTKIQNALKKGEYHKFESAERMTKRANRALGVVRKRLGQDAAKFFSNEVQEVIAQGGMNETNMSDVLLERIIGETRDLLQIDFFSRGQAMSRRIGRVVTKLPGNRVSYGTGFLIAPGLMMTNWHVLETSADADRSQLQLDYQAGSTAQSFALDTQKFFINDKSLDFAIAAVKGVSDRGAALADYGWCPLVGAEGKISIGEPVNIIQHPLGEMKQVAFRENKLLDLDQTNRSFAYYEADTEQGSSGSAVFNDQWEVVALHHSGVPKTNAKGEWLKKDGSVFKKGDNPRDIVWVANEGIRVSALVAHLKALKLDEASMKIIRSIISATEPVHEKLAAKSDNRSTSLPHARTAPPQRQPIVQAAPQRIINNVFNFYGNTQVIVAGEGSSTTSATDDNTQLTKQAGASKGAKPEELGVGAVAGTFSVLEKITPEPFSTPRPGYDRNFLGFEVLLPQPQGDAVGLALEIPGADPDEPFELRYHHYSIIMNKERKLAFIAAVNFDPNAPVSHPREKGADHWFYDTRIDEEFQLGEDLYAVNPLDRGHLARRNDAGWGDTKEEAKLCSDDTFIFTNCSPQHEVFNQSTLANKAGVILWGNIEEHIMKQGKVNKRRVTIFNGPIFNENDRWYRDIAQIPKEFWKVVVFADDNGLPRAAAFKLSQASLITKDSLKEKFDFEPYASFQVRVSDLAAETGLDFSQLEAFDTQAEEGLEEFAGDPKPLSDLSAIRL